MSPVDLIRQATADGIDLSVQGGRLILESPSGPPSRELLVLITAHKAAIVACLDEHARDVALRTGYAQWVAHLPALLPLERQEVESLAEELAVSGGLGQFAVCPCTGWHALDNRDRLAAVTVWQLTAGELSPERAA